MTKIETAITEYGKITAGTTSTTAAIEVIKNMYRTNYGYHTITTKINAAQKTQITAAGLRLCLKKHGLSSIKSRHNPAATQETPTATTTTEYIDKIITEQEIKIPRLIIDLDVLTNLIDELRRVNSLELKLITSQLFDTLKSLKQIYKSSPNPEIYKLINKLDKFLNKFS